MPAKRLLLTQNPPADLTYRHSTPPWKSHWICHHAQHADQIAVVAYRRKFTLAKDEIIRVHVSADQRYELYVDGERIGRGPERGDKMNWFFESYDLDLAAGDHTIVAKTWWLGEYAPFAQITLRPGFFLHAETHEEVLGTGVAKWEAKILDGYTWHRAHFEGTFSCVGPKSHIDGEKFPWGFEKGEGDGWEAVMHVGDASPAWLLGEWQPNWQLRPATLPELFTQETHAGIVRHIDAENGKDAAIHAKNNHEREAGSWNALLAGDGSVFVPPHTFRRVIVDLQNYFTAYPQLTVSGGKGASIAINWAESLYVPGGATWEKGKRDEIEGKYVKAWGNEFFPDGSANRTFEPIWWEAGRYLEIRVTAADQELHLDGFALREIHYPHKFESKFEFGDSRLTDVIPLMKRTLEMCSNETYFDCPYYEQMMYVGDTRLDTLVTYATTRDDHLPRKAIETFDYSRITSGITHGRYPTSIHQYIPPFSLFWVHMVHDYAMWREDIAFVTARMPGVRAVLDAYRAHIRKDGLLDPMPGWNFCDWVPGWQGGNAPTGESKPIAQLNFLAVWTLRAAAELEDLVGEPEMAVRHRRSAATIATAAQNAFWDPGRKLYAEDLEHKHFSEHAQCMATLAGITQQPSALAADGLDRCTIYYTHYLFEAAAKRREMNLFFDRMNFWFDLKEHGFKTTVEMPEPARSDCHAWGTHPMYHYYASVLGVRPASMGFKNVRIEPQLGSLKKASAELLHPHGVIKVDFTRDGGETHGTIELPERVPGSLVLNGRLREISCGLTKF